MPAKSPDTSDPIGTVVGIAELSARILGQMAREPDRAPTLAEVYAQQVRLMLGDADLSPAPTAETLHQPLYHALQPLLPCQYALPPALAETHRAVCAQLASDQPNKYHRHSGLLLSGPRGTGKSEYASVLKGALGDSIGAYVLDLAKVANSPRPAEALVSVYEALQAEAERTGRYVVLQIDEFDICVREYASMESTSELHETARESGTTRHERTSSKTTIDQVGAQLFATLKSCISGDGRFGRVYTVPTTNLDVSKIPDTLTRDGRCLHVPMVHPFVHLRGQDSRLGLSDGKYQAHLSHPSHLAYALEIFAATHCRMRGLDQRPEGFETLIVEARGLVRRFAEMKPMWEQRFMGRRAVLSPEQIASIYGDIMRFLGKPDTQKRETGGFILGYERTPDISELTQSAVAGAYKTYLAEKQESDAVDSADVRRLLSELLPLPRV